MAAVALSRSPAVVAFVVVVLAAAVGPRGAEAKSSSGGNKPGPRTSPYEVNYGLWPSADLVARQQSQGAAPRVGGGGDDDNVGVGEEERAPPSSSSENNNNINSDNDDDNGPDANDGDGQGAETEAEAFFRLREMLCSPRAAATAATLAAKRPQPADGLLGNWWQRVAFARRFRSPMKRYLGVEIPDYVTHQGTAAVRTAVNQQFKNVLDSAGRRRK